MLSIVDSVKCRNIKIYRSSIARFERHLKKKGYSVSIINDLVFEKTRKVLQSKQKQLKKQGKGDKLNASAALTSEELKVLYDKALLNTLWLNNTLHFELLGCKNIVICAGER